MFWNKKTENNLDSTMIELGREVERGLLLLNATIVQHWEHEENYYYKAVSVMMDKLLKDKTLTNADRLEKAKQVLDLSKVYRNFIDERTAKFGDFILTRINQFEEMLEPLLKTKPYNKEKEWVKLSRDLCNIRVSEIIAIDTHIDTDEFIPKIIIADGGAPDHQTTEQEKNDFAHLCATYGAKRKVAYEDEKKIEPHRSNIAQDMFGKLDDYMKDGSYSRLLMK